MIAPKPNDATGPPTTDPLEAALQAGSEALVELRLVQAAHPLPADVRSHLTEAIDRLRSALIEVRVANDSNQSVLAHGFVARRDPARQPPP